MMIELYTAGTPNGQKVSIALEEMNIPYNVHPINILEGEQHTPEYLKLCPNGRIPTIVDTDFDNLAIFESGAILLHLAELSGQFLPTERATRSKVFQWLMYQMAAVGPMQGQANVFNRYASEKLPWAIDRYMRECRRIYEVLNGQLASSEYLAGDYSIADMATYPWIKLYEWTGLNIEGLDHLQNWVKRLDERPAVQAGMKVAVPDDFEATSEKAQDSAELARNILV